MLIKNFEERDEWRLRVLAEVWRIALVILLLVQPDSAVSQDSQDAVETAVWRSVKCCASAGEVQVYLETYPTGRYVTRAQACLEDQLGLDRATRVLVQEGLEVLEYESGPMDGAFGPQTRRAVEQWQAANGYAATGYLTRAQADTLIEEGSEGRAKRQIRAQLAIIIALTLEVEDGWEETHNPNFDRLNNGDSDSLSFVLEEGKTYRVASACDGNCSDIDLVLYDENANEISRDTESDALPIVEVSPSRTGRFRLQVAMRSCSENPCYYGIVIVGRESQEGSATHERRQEVFQDCPTCPELVVVPAGSYRMGSPSHEEGRDDDEGPQHQVTIPQPFAVGVYEVTREEYGQFVSETAHDSGQSCYVWEEGSLEERSGRSWREPGFQQTAHDPVVCVNWHDAQAYVRWLSNKTGQAYRLLSEAEWEYVARAGTSTPFHTGGTISTSQANYDGNSTYGGGRRGEYRQRTVPVGSFQPNAFGLYDVHGNVWKWVQDCWNENYNGAPRDGQVWERGDCSRHVLRGGSWFDGPRVLRSAIRNWDSADNRNYSVGFRIARMLPSSDVPPAVPSILAAERPEPAEVEAGLGLTREERVLIQQGLTAVGQESGPADGLFGGPQTRTRQAIRAWQAAKELAVSGYLDREQADALLALGQTQADDAAYAEAERTDTVAGYAAYLRAYPSGRHVQAARDRQPFTILAEPAGAQVRILNIPERYQAGMTLPAGEYQVEVSAEGYRTMTETIPHGAAPTERRIALEWAGRRVGENFRDCPTCPELVVVPAGSFMMGSPSSEADRDGDEGPVHRVTLARSFAVGVYEVTFAEWEACLAGGGCGGHRPGGEGGRHPVTDVSWDDAQSYVAWLSNETGQAYRLLSEAEWEYVARAGTTTPYHFGTTISNTQANYGRYGILASTELVGSYAPNAFGLYDVHGNMREWVQDCWNDSYNGAPSDGRAWEHGECDRHVLRGGSWDYNPRDIRSASRHRLTADFRYDYLGFRIARTLP